MQHTSVKALCIEKFSNGDRWKRFRFSFPRQITYIGYAEISSSQYVLAFIILRMGCEKHLTSCCWVSLPKQQLMHFTHSWRVEEVVSLPGESWRQLICFVVCACMCQWFFELQLQCIFQLCWRFVFIVQVLFDLIAGAVLGVAYKQWTPCRLVGRHKHFWEHTVSIFRAKRKKETVYFFKTLVSTFKSTLRYYTQDQHYHVHHR